MDELIRQLNNLTITTQKLEKYVQQLHTEKQDLIRKIAVLEEEQQAKEEEFIALRERYEANKAVKGLVEVENSDEIKEKIENYLKEIDICLKIFGDQNLVGNTVN